MIPKTKEEAIKTAREKTLENMKNFGS